MNIDSEVKFELATVTGQGFGYSAKKTLFFRIDFKFENLRSEDGDIVTGSHKTYLNANTTEKTFEILMKNLEILGWTGNDLDDLNPESPMFYNLTGAKCLLTTEMEVHEGKSYAKIKYINPVKDYTPADSQAVRAETDRLKGKIAAYRARNKQ